MTYTQYTAEKLIEQVRNLTGSPDSGSVSTRDEDLILHINEGIKSYLIPKVLKLNEAYFIVRQRENVIAGESLYTLPSRAMYDKLKEVYFIDDQGERVYLMHVPVNLLHRYNSQGSTYLIGYHIVGNRINLIPESEDNQYSGQLEYWFYFRGGDIVKSTECRQIQSVDTTTRTIALTEDVPTTWNNTYKFDIHSNESGAAIKDWSMSPSVVTGNQMVFITEIDGSVFGKQALQAGDWVCLEGEAALPCVPKEMHPIICRAAAIAVAESLDNANGVATHSQILSEYLNQQIGAMENRVENKPIRPSGVKGFLRSRRRGISW